MMGQCRFIACNTCTMLVQDVDSGRGCVHVGAEGMWEIPVLSAQFFCEPETALKKAVYLRKRNEAQI